MRFLLALILLVEPSFALALEPQYPRPATNFSCRTFKAEAQAMYDEANTEYKACYSGYSLCGDAPQRRGRAIALLGKVSECFQEASTPAPISPDKQNSPEWSRQRPLEKGPASPVENAQEEIAKRLAAARKERAERAEKLHPSIATNERLHAEQMEAFNKATALREYKEERAKLNADLATQKSRQDEMQKTIERDRRDEATQQSPPDQFAKATPTEPAGPVHPFAKCPLAVWHHMKCFQNTITSGDFKFRYEKCLPFGGYRGRMADGLCELGPGDEAEVAEWMNVRP